MPALQALIEGIRGGAIEIVDLTGRSRPPVVAPGGGGTQWAIVCHRPRHHDTAIVAEPMPGPVITGPGIGSQD